MILEIGVTTVMTVMTLVILPRGPLNITIPLPRTIAIINRIQKKLLYFFIFF